jgi:TPR repeat protein
MSQLTPKELNQLGDAAFYGIDQEKNIERAFTYYKEAADMNNPVGIYNLGKYYLAKNQYKQAIQWLKKATDLDYAPALTSLYEMYMTGQGVRKSKKKAFKYLKAAADLADVTIYHLMGYMYEEGLGTRANESLAFEYYEKSANNNQVKGMYRLGLLLLKQKNKEKEHENAFYWLDKAAHMHYKPAIKHCISLYEQGHTYVQKRSQLYLDEMAFHYLELLAKTKDVEALIKVAKAYETGKTYLSANHQKAFEYYRILHELDEIDGYLGLGKSYLYGLWVDKDYQKAKDYLEIASSRNNVEAKTLLGDIYRHGYGVKADYNLAKEHYLGAAEANHVDALINLSLLHYRNQIKNANPLQALTYINRAVEMESPKAYFWKGLYHELGIGVDKNIEEAMQAYKRAIQLGNNASRYKLANLLYRDLKKHKRSKRKMDATFEEIKTLLLTYIEAVDSDNRLKAMYVLAEIYQEDLFSQASQKTSRYYFELAAENGYGKAMNRLYEIYLDEDIQTSLDWLKKACENPIDGEAYYLLADLYEKGLGQIKKDPVQAQKLLAKSAKLNYSKAIEKLTFEGESKDEH